MRNLKSRKIKKIMPSPPSGSNLGNRTIRQGIITGAETWVGGRNGGDRRALWSCCIPASSRTSAGRTSRRGGHNPPTGPDTAAGSPIPCRRPTCPWTPGAKSSGSPALLDKTTASEASLRRGRLANRPRQVSLDNVYQGVVMLKPPPPPGCPSSRCDRSSASGRWSCCRPADGATGRRRSPL